MQETHKRCTVESAAWEYFKWFVMSECKHIRLQWWHRGRGEVGGFWYL